MSSEIRLRSEWLSLLKGEFEQPYMSRLSAFLRAEKAAGKTIYPPAGQFFAALEATPPNFFEYAVVGGPFPVVRHRGVVSFLELTGEGTDVIWDVEFQPSATGNLFCCCGAGLVVLVRVSLGSMLRTLRRSCG